MLKFLKMLQLTILLYSFIKVQVEVQRKAGVLQVIKRKIAILSVFLSLFYALPPVSGQRAKHNTLKM